VAAQATASNSNLRWLRVRDLNLRRLGPYDRKSRRGQLSIRYGDRNYDRSINLVCIGSLARSAAYYANLRDCAPSKDAPPPSRFHRGGGGSEHRARRCLRSLFGSAEFENLSCTAAFVSTKMIETDCHPELLLQQS
jgi:hypothetical protein